MFIVFNIDEAVSLLRVENVQDICCIALPKDVNYADYMLIGTCLSPKHLNSTFISFYRSYKKYRIKNNALKEYVRKASNETKWRAIDLGSIVINLFVNESREFYDLESLWTCGVENDEKYHEFLALKKKIEEKIFLVEEEENKKEP